MPRGTRRASSPPSPSFTAFRSRCTAFTSATAEVSPGPPLRPAGCRARLNRRQTTAVALLGSVAAGRRIPLPLVALRLRSLRSLRPGPQGRALARDRAARLRLLSRAVTNPHVPLKCLHGRRRCAPPLEGGSAPRRRPFRRHAPGTPARQELRPSTSSGLRVAGAPCGHGSRPAFRCAPLRSRTARPALSLRPVARRLTRRANQNQQLRRKCMAAISSANPAVLNRPRLPFLR